MRKRSKLVLLILLSSIAISTAVYLAALEAKQCRGSADCDDAYDACAYSQEYIHSYIDGTLCFNMECRTHVKVLCMDFEDYGQGTPREKCYYYAHAYCWSMVYAGECKDSLIY